MNAAVNAPLKSLQSKLDLIRDRTHGVVEGYSAGLFLWGEGGTSKSFTIEQTLTELGTPFKLSNSRITGKGVFDLLRDHPDVVHVLEDVETLFADKNSFGVLRSALWGQDGKDAKQERVVVWHTARGREEFIFTGGIIMVASDESVLPIIDAGLFATALKTGLASLKPAAASRRGSSRFTAPTTDGPLAEPANREKVKQAIALLDMGCGAVVTRRKVW